MRRFDGPIGGRPLMSFDFVGKFNRGVIRLASAVLSKVDEGEGE